MPRMIWAGLLRKSPAEYQKGQLPENARKLVMPSSMEEMMLRALPFLVLPVGMICLSMFLKTILSGQIVIHPAYLPLGLLAGFAGLLLHEVLHAVVYPSQATVYIGVYPRAFAAVALASHPLSRGRFILMSLLPAILGILPLVLFLSSPAEARHLNGFLFGFAIMGLTSPYPDFYNVFQVLRQTPAGCRVQCFGDDLYWLP